MSQKYAPVALFAFNRPDHFASTLKALANNTQAKQTPVVVFLDGPKSELDRSAQDQIKKFIKSGIDKNFKSLELIHAEFNQGLAQSIIAGVTQIVKKYGHIIVLEDDLVTAPHFLHYMNAALDRYENEERVISIHGYLKPIDVGSEPFFLRGADCWGWATWQRGWDLFEPDGKKLLNEIVSKNLEFEFTYQNSYDYMGMLRGQIAGKNNSWAIRWYASAFLANKLTLYPPKSLVKNIGFDGSGENCSETSVFDVELKSDIIEKFPNQIEASALAYREYCKFFSSIKLSIAERVVNKIKNMVKSNG